MRDHRIDFFRGLALIVIFVDHVPYNILGFLTPRNYGLSDAAEAFVLISGVSAAYAYYGRFVSGDALPASGLALRRAAVLYVAQLFGTMAILGIFAGGAIYFADPSILQQNNMGAFVADPVRGSLGVTTLGLQFGFFNILPMYMIFLAVLPLIMLLARAHLALAFAASFLVYAVAGTWRLNLPNYPLEGDWYFNPLAWQFLFIIGFLAGTRLRSGATVPYNATLYRVALVWLLAAAVWVLGGLWGRLPDLPLPFIVYGNDKTFLTMGRLLHILALAYVICHSPVAPWLRLRLTASNPVVLIGRHGLVSFCAGTLLCMIGLIVKLKTGAGVLFDVLFVAAGLLALIAIAGGLDWLRKPRSERPPSSHPEDRPVTATLIAAE